MKKAQHSNITFTPLELIFTMLGEASTTKIARNKDAIGFVENKDAVTKENYLIEPENKKKLENKKLKL